MGFQENERQKEFQEKRQKAIVWWILQQSIIARTLLFLNTWQI